MCGADAPRVSSGASCWMVAVSFLAAFRTCPAGLVVGRVRRQEDRGDALQQPAGPVEAGQGSGVVGAGVVRDDRDLAGAGFALEPVRCEGRLPGVPVLLDRVRRDCSAGRGRASEKDWDVLRRSTDRPGALPSFGGCMRRVQASCSKRPGQDGLEFLLPGADGFHRVPVPRMPGRDPAHPGGPPVGRPLLHRPLRPLDRLSDDARIGATGGVQDRLGLHPGEHATAGTPPPPDQDGGLLRGDPDPHAPTASETAQETHETRPRPRGAINLGWQPCFITVIRHPQPPRGRRVQTPPYFAMNRLNSNNQIR